MPRRSRLTSFESSKPAKSPEGKSHNGNKPNKARRAARLEPFMSNRQLGCQNVHTTPTSSCSTTLLGVDCTRADLAAPNQLKATAVRQLNLILLIVRLESVRESKHLQPWGPIDVSHRLGKAPTQPHVPQRHGPHHPAKRLVKGMKKTEVFQGLGKVYRLQRLVELVAEFEKLEEIRKA